MQWHCTLQASCCMHNTNTNTETKTKMKFRTLNRMNGGHLSQSISISLKIQETSKWHLAKKNDSETLFPKNKNEMKILVFNFVCQKRFKQWFELFFSLSTCELMSCQHNIKTKKKMFSFLCIFPSVWPKVFYLFSILRIEYKT